MTKKIINIGSGEKSGDGESLRSAFSKINDNFDELYTGSLDNVTQSIVPSVTDTYDLGSPTKQWRSLYVTNNTVYFGGIPLSVTDDGTILVNGQVAATPGGGTTWDSISGKPTIPTVVSDLTNDTGYLTQEDLVAEVTDGGNTARAGLRYSTSSVSIGAVQDPVGD